MARWILSSLLGGFSTGAMGLAMIGLAMIGLGAGGLGHGPALENQNAMSRGPDGVRVLADFWTHPGPLDENTIDELGLDSWNKTEQPFDGETGFVATRFSIPSESARQPRLLCLGLGEPPTLWLDGVRLSPLSVLDGKTAAWVLPADQLGEGEHTLLWARSNDHRSGPRFLVGPSSAHSWKRILEEPCVDTSLMNFAIEAGVEANGMAISKVWSRSSARDPILAALVNLQLRIRGQQVAIDAFESVDVQGAFPQRRVQLRDSRLGDVDIDFSFSAPAYPGDLEFSSLPVIRGTLSARTSSKTPIPIEVNLSTLPLAVSPLEISEQTELTIVRSDQVAIAMSGLDVRVEEGAIPSVSSYDRAVQVERSLSQVTLDFFVAIEAPGHPDPAESIRSVHRQIPRVRQGLRRFRDRLPTLRIETIDRALAPSIADGLSAFAISDDGVASHSALSPSERFWSSLPLLLFYPALEARELDRLLAAEQTLESPSILRALRYLWWVRDTERAQAWSTRLEEDLASSVQNGENGSAFVRGAVEAMGEIEGLEAPALAVAEDRSLLEELRLDELPCWARGFAALSSPESPRTDVLETWSRCRGEGTLADDDLETLRSALETDHIVDRSLALSMILFGIYGAERVAPDRLRLGPSFYSDRLNGHVPLPEGSLQITVTRSTQRNPTRRTVRFRLMGELDRALDVEVVAGDGSGSSEILALDKGRSTQMIELDL